MGRNPMFLTRKAIADAVEKGEIVISPYNPTHLAPNSYDVTLNEQLLVYRLNPNTVLDVKQQNPTTDIIIPPHGLVLQPQTLYIGMTNETAVSHCYVPMFEGRSSMGRLGINSHITAGFGDVGWGFERGAHGEIICHYPTWTLEITVVHPIRIYPGIRIGQVYFVEPKGEIEWYQGKYSKQKLPTASRSWVDFTQS